MAPWLCKNCHQYLPHPTQITPPSAITLNSWDLRLGSWASNYTPVDRSGWYTSLSSYALSVILRVSFWFWDCTDWCAVPSSWAGTLKPLVVWSNQDTVTGNLCDANVVVGCGHPLGRNSAGHCHHRTRRTCRETDVVIVSLQPKSPPTPTSRLQAALCISPY